jgi:hypothetical protein
MALIRITFEVYSALRDPDRLTNSLNFGGGAAAAARAQK